ncbi:hypothetical protein GCM10015536_72750 [Streptomyces griseomycini]|nr:hypothetical protein GCM10015536_72750 [Streptomyces griseomycini]
MAHAPSVATTPENWWQSRITAHSAPSPSHLPHPAPSRSAPVSHAQKWKARPRVKVLGYATVSASEVSPGKPLHGNGVVPHRSSRLSRASAGAARCAPSVRTYRTTPVTSSASPTTAARRRTTNTDSPVARAAVPSSSVHGE